MNGGDNARPQILLSTVPDYSKDDIFTRLDHPYGEVCSIRIGGQGYVMEIREMIA